ncbi:ATPase, T2SS/T4P/T4SS family, partial [Bacillus cereus group sp. Bce020]|uniref:ATPase, T2SS/T4P/T4SS family n=1 Tax=Bacillus cereus group sp. Bce020 TaxID=3445246 RepID=UPI003F6A3AE2
MGIEPFNLASSLSLIIAQRLARRLCPNCKVAKQPNVTEQQQFGLSADLPLYTADPNGCSECTKGYSGRIGIY